MHANDVNNNFCRGDKYFREGPYISNISVSGGPYISNISVPGVQIFQYVWTGGTKIGGPIFS